MSATHQITISEPRAMRACSYVHNRRNTSLFLSCNSVRSSLLLLHGPAFKFAHDACAYIQNNQITSMHANVSDVNTHSYVYSSQQDALSPHSFRPRWQVRNQRRFRCARAANSLGCCLNFLCICRRIGRSSSNRSTATVIAIVACTYWLILFNFGFGFHQ